VKESNLVFHVHPKIRYYYHRFYEGFYLENGREEKYDMFNEYNKNARLINSLKNNGNGANNLAFEFFDEYQFDAGKSKVMLENGIEYSFSMNDSKRQNFSPTFYFNSEIILIKDLEASEKKNVLGYYRNYIPTYNHGAFEAMDCVIKSQGKFLIPAHPSFAVLDSSGKILTIKEGKIIEVQENTEIPKNEQYGFRVFCC